MSKKIIIFSAVAAICGLWPAEATNGQRGPRGRKFVSGLGGVYREGDLLVRFAPKANGMQRGPAEKAQILNSLGGGIEKHRYKLVPGLSLVELAPGRKVENALRAFNNRPEILYAGPNYKLELMSTEPDDTHYESDNLWALHNVIQDADIDAPEAWDIATDAEDVIVAVIDTGIYYEHEDLAANMWVNEAELNGTGGVDDDNNVHVDDIYGWNFYADNNNVADEYSVGNNQGHGTHIAGMIGGVGNNGEGVVGVCWDVQIMNLKIFPVETPDYESNAVVSGAVAAIEYAVDKGARVISNAWGFYVFVEDGDPNYFWDDDWKDSLEDTINTAGEAGVLFIFCAGNYTGNDNDVNPMYPQNFDCNNIIVVTGTTASDEFGTYAFGPNTVDLGAPGGGLLSSNKNGGYNYVQGTSYAQAWVAGAAALIWGMNPDLTYLEVKDILLDTVDELESLEGKCVTQGRLNLYKALHRASLYVKSGGFTIKNDSGEPVARFSDSGDLFLAGTLTQNATPTATGNDEFRVQHSDGTDVAIIDMTNGNMYLAGSVQAIWAEPSAGSDDFIIKDSGGTVVAYINDSGDLYLKKKVYGPEP